MTVETIFKKKGQLWHFLQNHLPNPIGEIDASEALRAPGWDELSEDPESLPGQSRDNGEGGKAKEGRGGFVWEREDDDDLLPKHLVFLLCALNTPRLFTEFTAS